MNQQDMRRTEVIFSDFPTLGTVEYILRHFCRILQCYSPLPVSFVPQLIPSQESRSPCRPVRVCVMFSCHVACQYAHNSMQKPVYVSWEIISSSSVSASHFVKVTEHKRTISNNCFSDEEISKCHLVSHGFYILLSSLRVEHSVFPSNPPQTPVSQTISLAGFRKS